MGGKSAGLGSFNGGQMVSQKPAEVCHTSDLYQRPAALPLELAAQQVDCS